MGGRECQGERKREADQPNFIVARAVEEIDRLEAVGLVVCRRWVVGRLEVLAWALEQKVVRNRPKGWLELGSRAECAWVVDT
jgi:hypothetical protein